ncbi:MAG: thioredoxin [Cyclobacteriaceae bacterium]|nr:thioredoxin [Cyclobacteriaceae bacterium]MCH8517301.1 thioredoxin [Cyclobacteriaceae bacterium]
MAKKSFAQLIKSSDVPVLVDFYADWCGPCQTMSPVVSEMAKEYSGALKVIKVNVDKNQAAAINYQVRSIPTFILFDRGKQIWKQGGIIPTREFRKILDQKLKLNK